MLLLRLRLVHVWLLLVRGLPDLPADGRTLGTDTIDFFPFVWAGLKCTICVR